MPQILMTIPYLNRSAALEKRFGQTFKAHAKQSSQSDGVIPPLSSTLVKFSSNRFSTSCMALLGGNGFFRRRIAFVSSAADHCPRAVKSASLVAVANSVSYTVE